MKTYPSIKGPGQAPKGEHCIAFYKYDGSNLRFEWNSKRGWYKFGTRKRLFDKNDVVYGKAIDQFLGKLGPEIDKILRGKYKAKQAIVFCEFFGPRSFAGQHKSYETHRLVLIDVGVDKKGFISPEEFVDNFGHLEDCAEEVYRGPLDDAFITAVRENEFGLMEGVVCKGGSGHKLWRCKIKTNTYRERLKEMYKDGWQKYWEE